jgi:hypothetical protein
LADADGGEKFVRILHLEDNADDFLIAESVMRKQGIVFKMTKASSGEEYREALSAGAFDLIVSDSGVPGFSGMAALELARANCPEVPFVFFSGNDNPQDIRRGLEAGAREFIAKNQVQRLAAVVKEIVESEAEPVLAKLEAQNRAMKRLVKVVQELSLARSLETVMAVVRRAARELTEADGATFVLQDNGKCFYAEEDAIAPLWKGQRFPMSACISGWVMINREVAIIEDIYADSRIPAEAYRPTFVKSLVMVPVRTEAPIAAIGNYWAKPHLATADEVELLQALANTTAVALENVQLYSELEERVRDGTQRLEQANHELETFAYSVSHDLRNPLNVISGFVQLLSDPSAGTLTEKGNLYVERVLGTTRHMGDLISDLLRLSRITQAELNAEPVDLSKIVRELASEMAARDPKRQVEFRIEDGLQVTADRALLRVAMANLLSNAWKYSAKTEHAVIEFGGKAGEGEREFFVRDNGAGFDMAHAGKLFAPFQRLHSQKEFPGHGVGLATVLRVVHRHGGTIRGEAKPGEGAGFYFTLAAAAKNPFARAAVMNGSAGRQ